MLYLNLLNIKYFCLFNQESIENEYLQFYWSNILLGYLY